LNKQKAMSFIDDWRGEHLSAKGLRLLLRSRVEGFLTGEHLAVRLHEGVEFEQLKPYQPGDDTRKIDWRVFLRNRKLWVRQSPLSLNTVVHCALDVSASMLYKEEGRSKWAYAQLLAAAIGYIALQQGDTLKVWRCVEDRMQQSMPLFEVERLLKQLESMQPGGKQLPEIATSAELSKGRHLWMFFTDLYDSPRRWVASWKRLRALGHEVHCWHIMGQKEITCSWKGMLAFKSLETAKVKKVNVESYRKTYLRKMEAFLNEARQECLHAGVHYHRVLLQEPLHSVLWRELVG
jgi:uncharacterized protein (DUF58 family)